MNVLLLLRFKLSSHGAAKHFKFIQTNSNIVFEDKDRSEFKRPFLIVV